MPSVAFTLRLPSLYNASAGGGSGAGIVLGATRVGKGNTQHPFYHTHACIPTHLFLFYFYFYFLFLLFYFYFYFYSTSTYRGLPLSLIAVLPGRSWPLFILRTFWCALSHMGRLRSGNYGATREEGTSHTDRYYHTWDYLISNVRSAYTAPWSILPTPHLLDHVHATYHTVPIHILLVRLPSLPSIPHIRMRLPSLPTIPHTYYCA